MNKDLTPRCGSSSDGFALAVANRQLANSACNRYSLFSSNLYHGWGPMNHGASMMVVWCQLFWKERSARNSNNRSRQFMVHKSGRTSFAQRAVTLRNEIQRSPTRAEVFKKCYKGQKGYANAATEEVTNPENEDAIFREVLGPERKGRKRGMGRGITMRENNAFLRAQVEELTLQLAERDTRDKERDVKDVETRQKLADLEARFEYLSQSLIPQTPSSVPTPHQHLLSHVPYHSQWMNVPNQQRVQLPNCQRIYGPYHQQDLLNQQQLASHHTQRTKSFTELLRDGSNMNSEVLLGCPDHMGE